MPVMTQEVITGIFQGELCNSDYLDRIKAYDLYIAVSQ